MTCYFRKVNVNVQNHRYWSLSIILHFSPTSNIKFCSSWCHAFVLIEAPHLFLLGPCSLWATVFSSLTLVQDACMKCKLPRSLGTPTLKSPAATQHTRDTSHQERGKERPPSIHFHHLLTVQPTGIPKKLPEGVFRWEGDYGEQCGWKLPLIDPESKPAEGITPKRTVCPGENSQGPSSPILPTPRRQGQQARVHPDADKAPGMHPEQSHHASSAPKGAPVLTETTFLSSFFSPFNCQCSQTQVSLQCLASHLCPHLYQKG